MQLLQIQKSMNLQNNIQVKFWYEKVIMIVMHLADMCDNDDVILRRNLLIQLSALIEVGRFYFPNLNCLDGFGQEKPEAYRGHRHLALDILVYIYRIGQGDSFVNDKSQIIDLEREFTSIVYRAMNPPDRKKRLRRYANIILPDNMKIKERLKRLDS